jgi:hypothetical protein
VTARDVCVALLFGFVVRPFIVRMLRRFDELKKGGK